MEDIEIYSGDSDINHLIYEELQTQTAILTDLKSDFSNFKNDSDLYNPFLTISVFILMIFNLFFKVVR